MAYAVLFGDKTTIDTYIYDSFAISGIAHILAVSGLHVGFLVLIILFIFNALKLNKKLQFVLLAILLFGYAYLCGFSASIVRASIMALTLIFGSLLGEQNDNLSSLSFAGIIILLISPICLFTAGFLLSFASVFGIFIFYPIFTKLFKRIDMPKWLSSAISLTLSAQIATLPLLIYFFNSFNLLSVITNVLALPLFTLGYIVLFVSVILTAILPLFSFLFIIPNLAFTFVYLIAKFVSSVSFASVSLFSFGLFATIIYYVFVFSLSNFVMLKPKLKLITTFTLIVVMAISITLVNLPTSFSYYSVSKIYGVKNSAIISTDNNLTYLVDVGEGSSWDLYNIQNYLKTSKIKSLEGIIITNYNEKMQSVVAHLAQSYYAKRLFILETDSNILLYSLVSDLPIFTQLVQLEPNEATSEQNLTITSFTYLNEGLALKIEVNNFEIMFSASNLNASKIEALNALIDPELNILVLDEMSDNINNILSLNVNYDSLNYVLVKTNALNFKPSKLYDTNSFGSLQVKLNYDTISISY
ncbi:MAG: ComEC/Rec2 family competence protein [Clostridia bacterium]|nr:ComEC/Rec2 family competence protein [Clostridia bacterium]